jgi:antitoxin component HigA of HigAB toxin-antitoxin module
MKNRIVRDLPSTTQLRAHNAALAAELGDSSRVRETLSDARQLAAELAMQVRRAL